MNTLKVITGILFFLQCFLLHRAATTKYPCCGQTLGDSEGACRVGLTRVQK